MKILSVFRRKPSGDGFGSSSSLWASALAVACLIASGFAVFLLQSSKAGSRDIASLPLHDVVRWSWTLMALLGVQMAYQQLRMSRLRQQLRRREALFRIVTENAADMIAFI